jgi:hypothetical protein
MRSLLQLVPTFRSSYTISAITFYELRKAMGTNEFMILVPLFDLKSLGSFRRLRCRDFKLATLVTISALMIAAFAPAKPALAQKLVDPNIVAPEFREAAEKRRAEQVKMQRCQRKAEEAKVLPRDRTAHINQCLQADTDK